MANPVNPIQAIVQRLVAGNNVHIDGADAIDVSTWIDNVARNFLQQRPRHAIVRVSMFALNAQHIGCNTLDHMFVHHRGALAGARLLIIQDCEGISINKLVEINRTLQSICHSGHGFGGKLLLLSSNLCALEPTGALANDVFLTHHPIWRGLNLRSARVALAPHNGIQPEMMMAEMRSGALISPSSVRRFAAASISHVNVTPQVMLALDQIVCARTNNARYWSLMQLMVQYPQQPRTAFQCMSTTNVVCRHADCTQALYVALTLPVRLTRPINIGRGNARRVIPNGSHGVVTACTIAPDTITVDFNGLQVRMVRTLDEHQTHSCYQFGLESQLVCTVDRASGMRWNNIMVDLTHNGAVVATRFGQCYAACAKARNRFRIYMGNANMISFDPRCGPWL